MATLSDSFLKKLRSVRAKRPRRVIEHILEHGSITTEQLKDRYGYNHPPRAARDVREHGIPLVTFRVTSSDGRQIGAYKFGEPDSVRDNLSGRKPFSKKFKTNLIVKTGAKCSICLTKYDARYLQIDHRVTYQIAGEFKFDPEFDDVMLLCGSCNRSKSWTCENCGNWTDREEDKCLTCYWASPENYTHIALCLTRRLDIVWTEEEIEDYENLVNSAGKQKLPDFVKDALRKLNGSGSGKDE